MFADIFKSTNNNTKDIKYFDEQDNISLEETQEKTGGNSSKELEIRLDLTNLLEGGNNFNETEEYLNPEKMFVNYLENILSKWKHSNLKDEHRPECANKSNGGIDLKSSEITALIRGTGYELIKQIGKKIISGDFNLTTISFPIKVMLPITILQSIAKSVFQFPIYLNLASLQNDPLEKFKFTIIATLSCFHSSGVFLKPLNPILGETYEMLYEDGSKIYLEQSSHHPPISHYIMYGPGNSYKFYGFSNFISGAGLNSVKLSNKGKRTFEFKDGTKIVSNFCQESFSNTFWGTLRHESIGETIFKDTTNGFECSIKYGSVKKKQTDFFSGEIKLKGITVCKVYGSYLSFIEFDGIRYWDIRENVPIKPIEIEKQLTSSSLYREDRIRLETKLMDQAQLAKEKLEDVQRADKKLREKFSKLHK